MEFGTVLPKGDQLPLTTKEEFNYDDDVEYFTSKLHEQSREYKSRMLSIGFCAIFLLVAVCLTTVAVFTSIGDSSAGVNEPIQFLRILLDVESPTGREKEIADIVSAWLIARSWKIQTQSVTENTYNVFAHRGVTNPTLIVTTHLDTAPGFFNSSEDATNVYGRGATSAKGVLISQLFAVQQLIDEKSVTNEEIGFLFVTHGETGGDGMKKAAELGLTPKFMLGGQPTQMKLTSGFQGTLSFRLEHTGVEGYSGYPSYGASAVLPLMQQLLALQAAEWPSDEFFGQTTVNIGVIDGGLAGNIIAGSAHAEVVLHSAVKVALLKPKILALCPNSSITWLYEQDPYRCDIVPGFDTSLSNLGSPISFFPGDHQSYLFGPGSVLNSHSSKEFISKENLLSGIQKTKTLIMNILAQEKSL